MLEYFTYKKVKKHQAEKHDAQKAAEKAPESSRTPVLNDDDESFLQRIVSDEGTPPALPERPASALRNEVGDNAGHDAQVVAIDPAVAEKAGEGQAKEKNIATKEKNNEKKTKDDKDAKKSNRFSFFSKKPKNDDGLKPSEAVAGDEATKEEDDINRVLDDLNLAAVNNRAFSLSAESQALVRDFTFILKDIINGVPTAYDDLVKLLDSSQGTLQKSFDSLPSFLQKLVTQLPTKLTSSLAPELLAVAAESQALGADVGKGGGFSAAAKKMLTPTSLKDLVTKPGAVVGMLRTIMNALKLRWPAFLGTNVLWSLGLFVLLFVFWYCHKRGREVRLDKERAVDSEGRIVELDDDPMLAGPDAGSAGVQAGSHSAAGTSGPAPAAPVLKSEKDVSDPKAVDPAIGAAKKAAGK